MYMYMYTNIKSILFFVAQIWKPEMLRVKTFEVLWMVLLCCRIVQPAPREFLASGFSNSIQYGFVTFCAVSI